MSIIAFETVTDGDGALQIERPPASHLRMFVVNTGLVEDKQSVRAVDFV